MRQKFEIYKIAYKHCNQIYIGQTKRLIDTRYNSTSYYYLLVQEIV